MPRIYIYDTTLRDGAQTEGISFSLKDKQEILSALDEFGADFVECGMPASNPKDAELFESLRGRRTGTRVVAFGSTCRPETSAEKDPQLRMLADSSADTVCIFGKAWDFHVTDALRTTLEENLRMIDDSVRFLRSEGKEVIFDAEHFFDGYTDNTEYAMRVAETAAAAGAEWIVLCDTNGGTLVESVAEITSKVVRGISVPVGIHCHNDSDLAVACSLAAVRSGATMVQGTVNGLGERCGNANLCSIIPNLMLKMGCKTGVGLEGLTHLSKKVSEVANTRNIPHLPYVGDKAFAHKGGMHISALRKDTRTYEHVRPETVGNIRRILVSEVSGRASIEEKMRILGIPATDKNIGSILNTVKELESKGYQFDGADASFELMVRKSSGNFNDPFDIAGFRLFIDEVGDNKLTSEASVKVVDRLGNVEHTASDGNGPVDALDSALRKALTKFYPFLSEIRLVDYKVRVLDEKAATAAPVRVLITSSDGKESWTTIGVSDNVIEASLIALSDSIEFAIFRKETGGKGSE
ncbi:MAG: citramalate synthase [Candidatus Methanomethylophilaceae archaeon]|nr:citramalate synthase [Candidatus Methanomethylophilaceae archaeon]